MRHTISTQITEFKKCLFELGSIIICEICGKQLYDDNNTHIDHIVRFIILANEFIKTEDNIQTKSTGYDRIITDEVIRQRWYNYHKQHAQLRALCAYCNTHRDYDDIL